MSEKTNIFEDTEWHESILPISLTVILSVILIVLIIIRIVQCIQRKKSKNPKDPESGALEDVVVNARPESQNPVKEKRIKALKGKKVAGVEASVENGSLLKSGRRSNPTRNSENKSWYDSKLIPFIDDSPGSLDNLYLPGNTIAEVA